MSEATKEQPSDSVIEHFWPDHLSGQEVKTKWPRGRNAVIASVRVEEVFDKQINQGKEMVVIFFKDIKRGLVTNKTNGRWLANHIGGDADKWAGKEVSLQAANRSNGTIGVDIGEAIQD